MMGDLGATNPTIGRYSPLSNQTLPYLTLYLKPYLGMEALLGKPRNKKNGKKR